VYYGRLEDDSEVAVKMRSESSSHGLDEFLAEVFSPLVDKIVVSKASLVRLYEFTCRIRNSLFVLCLTTLHRLIA
jgi:hypothetical protein